MSLAWPSSKDPDEVLDFVIDWTAALAGDTIATSVWSRVDGDVVIGSQSNTTTRATVWVSGGTHGSTLLNRITTAGGRTMDQSVFLSVTSN